MPGETLETIAMAHDIFISHASDDRPVSDAICSALENGRLRCWVAPRDVQPGRSFAGEITRAIQNSKAMVLIFSARSNNSEQVLREVQLAVKSHLHIIQFRIEDVHLNDDLEYFLGTPHWLDAMTPPLEDHIERLTSAVRALLEVAAEEHPKSILAPASPAVELTESPSDQPPAQKEEPSPVVLERKSAERFAVEATTRAEGESTAAQTAPVPVPDPTALKPTRIGAEPTSPRVLPQRTISKRSLLIGGGVVAGLFLVSLLLVLRPWKSPETEITGDQKNTVADRVERTPIAVSGPLLLIGTNYRINKDDLLRPLVAERYGFIDRAGKIIISPQWIDAYSFQEGLAAVKQDGKWGFIDQSGKMVIPSQWDETYFFREGVAAVNHGGKWGFINKAGKVVIEPQWESAHNFQEGLAPVQVGEKWGFIDKTGRIVVQPQWDDAFFFEGGLAQVRQGSKYGFIDTSGKVVIQLRWFRVYDFSEGVASVALKEDGKWGFIDKTGKYVIQPQWDGASSCFEGLCPVARNGKWGFIDKTGKVVIQPQWDAAYGFSGGGLGLVERGGKVGLIDRQGRVVIELEWDNVDQYNEVKNEPDYYLFSRQDGNKVRAVWLDFNAKQIWSSADSTMPPP